MIWCIRGAISWGLLPLYTCSSRSGFDSSNTALHCKLSLYCSSSVSNEIPSCLMASLPKRLRSSSSVTLNPTSLLNCECSVSTCRVTVPKSGNGVDLPIRNDEEAFVYVSKVETHRFVTARRLGSRRSNSD